MPMNVLVADDDPIIRKLLKYSLEELGHHVLLAEHGQQALDQIELDRSVELVVSDWMMPGMNGLELCRRIRSMRRSNYVHVVLLTARQTREDFIEAMDAGADDFLSKPLDTTALHARLKAAERVTRLQADLRRNNQLLSAANQKLTEAYEQLRADMEAAARLQKSLLPQPLSRVGNVLFASALFPSASVSGDVYNYFPLNDGSVAMYAVDVAGHGARAALMSVTLSRVLTAESFVDSSAHTRRPDDIVAELNQRFQANYPNLDYFTMIGAVLTPAGTLRFCQAGHPHPIIVPRNRNEAPFPIGPGGFPVALMDGMDFSSSEVSLRIGDRVLLHSDGVTECTSPSGVLYSEQRLRELLGKHRHTPLDELMEIIRSSLVDWQDKEDFSDDVSMMAFEILNEQE